jgi:RND family efflux transporter MFP subunit
MSKRILGLAGAAAIALIGIWIGTRWVGRPDGAVAQGQGQRAISVEAATAVRKKSPVMVEALGTVTPIASVAIKPRIDSEITAIHFADGALVKQGDVLLTLDSRAVEAQIEQAEGNVARDQAQLEGAERDVRRYTDLVGKGATPVVNLDNAKTQVGVYAASKKADQAQLENLRVQLSYTTIRAPITGRISAAAVKVGNIVRTADVMPIATIIQTAPIYVSFNVPQNTLPDIRKAIAAESATVEATIAGEARRAGGAVTMVENTVDPGTGMVAVRATMPNSDELLWPGTLVTAQMTLRYEDAVVVPSSAVQVSQAGNFVFVVKDGKATYRPVKVARTHGGETALEQGLESGEVIVTDGFLQLTDGARVDVRQRPAGA